MHKKKRHTNNNINNNQSNCDFKVENELIWLGLIKPTLLLSLLCLYVGNEVIIFGLFKFGFGLGFIFEFELDKGKCDCDLLKLFLKL